VLFIFVFGGYIWLSTGFLMTLIIYHNPRCSKSRELLALLDEKSIDYNVFKYMENSLTADKIYSLLKKLDYQSARELIRKNEPAFKNLNLKQESNEKILVKAMVKNPKLIERPIAIKNDRAIVCRPAQNVFFIL